jgi:CBS domain-containing protein
MDHAAVPRVSDYMTPAPMCVSPDDPLPTAHAMMRDHSFRHLPVMKGDTPVGVLSIHDVGLVHVLAGERPEEILVEDARSRDPYVVGPDVPLSKVARVMLERKTGSAVVVDGWRIAGLFTITDALGALVRCFPRCFTDPPGSREACTRPLVARWPMKTRTIPLSRAVGIATR